MGKIEIVDSIKKTTKWTGNIPVVNTLLSNSIVVAILISVIMLILILTNILPCIDVDIPISVLLKTFVYSALIFIPMLFLHSSIVRKNTEDEYKNYINDELLNPVDDGLEKIRSKPNISLSNQLSNDQLNENNKLNNQLDNNQQLDNQKKSGGSIGLELESKILESKILESKILESKILESNNYNPDKSETDKLQTFQEQANMIGGLLDNNQLDNNQLDNNQLDNDQLDNNQLNNLLDKNIFNNQSNEQSNDHLKLGGKKKSIPFSFRSKFN